MIVAGGLQISTIFLTLLLSLSLVASVLASVSGTGGGSLFIPIFSLAFPNDVHRAVPLAKVAVFGVALGACIVNFSGIKGAKRTSHYINYELATLIQPATLLGCLFGVFLNLLLPSLAIVVALICILTFVAYKTFVAAHQQQRDARLEASPDADDQQTPSTGIDERLSVNERPRLNARNLEYPPSRLFITAPQAEEGGDLDSHHHSFDRSPTGHRFEYDELSDVEASRRQQSPRDNPPSASFDVLSTPNIPQRPQRFKAGAQLSSSGIIDTCPSSGEVLSEATPLVQPYIKDTSSLYEASRTAARRADSRARSFEIIYLSLAWAVNAICLAMAGGPAALACGPVANRLWLLGLIIFHLSFICFNGRRMIAKKKVATADNLHLWWWVDPLKMAIYCSLSCLAGVAAGLLGIGGGLIKGPLLIHIGLRPINAVATSNYMIFFTSSTNVLAFLLAGRLDASHSAIFAVLTLIGGVLGATTLKRFFTLGRRQHVLTTILGCSIVLGGIAMVTVNIREILLRAQGYSGNVHEKTFEEACEYLNRENSAWKRLRLVDI